MQPIKDILLDRIFGTSSHGEGAVVGQVDRKRLSIREQTMFPFQPAIDAYKERRAKVRSESADEAAA